MKKLISLLVLLAAVHTSFAQGNDPYMGIVPAPVSVSKGKGEFKLTPETLIFADTPNTRAVRYLTGWLRKNGVAYSESATLLEYWDRVAFPNGDVWLIVTSVVSDPRYLLNDYTTSTHFKREADGSKWKPTPCRL